MIGGVIQNTPPVTKNLIIVNAILLLATYVMQSSMGIDLQNYLALHFVLGSKFNILQYITYMFMHANLMHLLFNMFSLWMFGKILEQVWGGKRYFTYYIITGVGAALLHTAVSYWELMPDLHYIDAFLQDPTVFSFNELKTNHKFWLNTYEIESLQRNWTNWTLNPTDATAKARVIDYILTYRSTFLNGHTVVGASGSVFGILLAFGYLFPNLKLMLLLPPIPIKAKYFVMGYGVLELYMGINNNPGDNVAHFAHLGGMLFGLILLLVWKQKRIQ